MGLLDSIGKLGTFLEEGFTPQSERLRNQAFREQILLSKLARERAEEQKRTFGLLGDLMFPDTPERATPEGAQANAGLLDAVQATNPPLGGKPPTPALLNLNNDLLDGRAAIARNQAANLPGRGAIPGVDRSNERKVFGLLTNIAPDLVAKGVASGIFPQTNERSTSQIKNFEFLRARTGKSDEELIDLIFDKARNDGLSDQMLKALQIQMQGFLLEEKKAARIKANETEDQAARARERTLKTSIKDTLELADLSDILEPTLLASGVPFADFFRTGTAGLNALLQAAGIDRSESNALIDNRSRFDKLATFAFLDLLDRFSGRSGTSAQLAIIERASGGTGASPGANRLIFADQLEAQLALASDSGIVIPDEVAIRERINELRGVTLDVTKLPGFNKLSPEDQAELIARQEAKNANRSR